MSADTAISNTIEELKCHLRNLITDSDYYRNKMVAIEKKIADMKETIYELENLQLGNKK